MEGAGGGGKQILLSSFIIYIKVIGYTFKGGNYLFHFFVY